VARTCTATTQEGAPCTAPAQKAKAFCFHHDPERKADQREASVLGGKVRAAQMDRRPEVREIDRLPALKDAAAAKVYIENTIHWVLRGTLDPRAATAIATCIRAFADLHRDEEVGTAAARAGVAGERHHAGTAAVEWACRRVASSSPGSLP
jgi:hypothetical protein